ncbi:MAG: DUF4249 domain-containing protein [Cytophagales bacterium]|nr:MAG: DUF4249 domain-containing protein [Runella sp.]TAG23835.1 MAG: DUF4249 domain-containing protein [Cytophagales bacterium]
MKHYWLILLAFLVASCDSGVEIERLSLENLVAVSSLISPQDSVVRVYVYQGKALGGIARPDKAIINDAKVSISDESTSKDLVFDAKTNSYAISNQELKITASKQYRLQVSTVGGLVLKATCIVPPNPAEVVIDGVKDGNDFFFNLNWPPIEKTAYFTFNFELTGVVFKPRLGATSGPSLSLFLALNNLIDNSSRPSKPIESKVINAFVAEKVSLKTTFFALDKNTFNYLNTKTEANNWNANTSEFVPNLREPQAVFSNIMGGVGIFGAYNKVVFITTIL